MALSAVPLLLVDLDGVLVQEVARPEGGRELWRLHQAPAAALAAAGCPVVILTHRSRAEARTILDAVGLPPGDLAACIAAEDLYLAALGRLRLKALWQGGLAKSFVLPLLARRFAARPARIGFIDDRRKNLLDLQAHGLGLGLLAPAGSDATGRPRSFDLAAAVTTFRQWAERGEPAGRLVELEPVALPDLAWCRSGMDTLRAERRLVNRIRLWGGRLRRRLAAPASGPGSPGAP